MQAQVSVVVEAFTSDAPESSGKPDTRKMDLEHWRRYASDCKSVHNRGTARKIRVIATQHINSFLTHKLATLTSVFKCSNKRLHPHSFVHGLVELQARELI